MSTLLKNPLVTSLIETCSVRTYSAGQTLVYPHDAEDFLYITRSGAVTLETISNEGEKKILYVFSAPTIFPMVNFTENTVSGPWFYVALSDVDAYKVSYRLFKEKLKTVDGFTTYNLLLKQVLSEYNELLTHISTHAKGDSREKILSMLTFFASHHTNTSSTAWQCVRFPVNHQLIADMTGLTRETVGVTLNLLVDQKIIRYFDRKTLEINVKKLSKHRAI